MTKTEIKEVLKELSNSELEKMLREQNIHVQVNIFTRSAINEQLFEKIDTCSDKEIEEFSKLYL